MNLHTKISSKALNSSKVLDSSQASRSLQKNVLTIIST